MSTEKIKTAIPANDEAIKTAIPQKQDKPITNDEPIREYGRLDNDRN